LQESENFYIKIELQSFYFTVWAYFGISIGDFGSGFFSHALHSRKKAIAFMMSFALICVLVLLFSGSVKTANMFYGLCCCLGFGTGYWAMFVTVAAEQFGTNLRATAATTIPNMVRGSVVLMTISYKFFKPTQGIIMAGAIVGLICFAIGFYSTLTIKETHNKDLDFLEE
jgi:MFS family permease